MISTKYSQNYLDEFCYELDKRNFREQLFDRLLIACATANYQNIVNYHRTSYNIFLKSLLVNTIFNHETSI